MVVTVNQSDRVILHNISWQQFENLIIDLGDSRTARLAYNRGVLEIMTPLPEHEYYKEVIGTIIQDIAEELELDYESLGSTTWKRESIQIGVEPDNCFYFQNESAIRGRLEFNLDNDPPPDLVLEIDLTSKSLHRFPIYGALGVPEIWCYDNGKLTIYLLNNGRYDASEQSSIFPTLPVAEIPNLIEKHRENGRRAIRKAIRAWVRKHCG